MPEAMVALVAASRIFVQSLECGQKNQWCALFLSFSKPCLQRQVRTCIERGAALVDNGQKHFYTLPELTNESVLDDANVPKREIVFISKEHPGICCIVVYKLVHGESFETQRPKFCPLLLDPPNTRKSEAIAQTLAEKIAKKVSDELQLGVNPKLLSIEQCVADTIGGWAMLVNTQLALVETRQILVDVVHRVLNERGEKLDILNMKSEGLGKQSKLFYSGAREVNNPDIWYYLCCRPM